MTQVNGVDRPVARSGVLLCRCVPGRTWFRRPALWQIGRDCGKVHGPTPRCGSRGSASDGARTAGRLARDVRSSCVRPGWDGMVAMNRIGRLLKSLTGKRQPGRYRESAGPETEARPSLAECSMLPGYYPRAIQGIVTCHPQKWPPRASLPTGCPQRPIGGYPAIRASGAKIAPSHENVNPELGQQERAGPTRKAVCWEGGSKQTTAWARR